MVEVSRVTGELALHPPTDLQPSGILQRKITTAQNSSLSLAPFAFPLFPLLSLPPLSLPSVPLSFPPLLFPFTPFPFPFFPLALSFPFPPFSLSFPLLSSP